MLSRAKTSGKLSCIVLEIGFIYTRCGIAGEELPRHVIRTAPCLFAPRYEVREEEEEEEDEEEVDDDDKSLSTERKPQSAIKVSQGSTNREIMEVLERDEIIEEENICYTYPPYTEGEWDIYWRPFIRHIFYHVLCVNPHDRRVFICEPPFLPYAAKVSLVHTLYDLDVPLLHFHPALSLPLYAFTSTSTALVVDISYSETRVLPIVNYTPLMHNMTTVAVGVRDVIKRLKKLLRNKYPNLSDDIEKRMKGEAAEDITVQSVLVRESNSSVEDVKSIPDIAVTLTTPIPTPQSYSTSTFALPVSSFTTSTLAYLSKFNLPPLTVTVKSDHRWQAAESLFGDNPENFSVTNAIIDTLNKVASESRSGLISNILLVGGGSELPGIIRRLFTSLFTVVSQHPTLSPLSDDIVLIGHTVPFIPSLLTWTGGSILSALLNDTGINSEYEWMSKDQMKNHVIGIKKQKIATHNNQHSKEGEEKEEAEEEYEEEEEDEYIRIPIPDWTYPIPNIIVNTPSTNDNDDISYYSVSKPSISLPKSSMKTDIDELISEQTF